MSKSESYFVQRGSTFSLQDGASSKTHDVLPPGNYVVKRSMFGFYLEQVKDFGDQGKIYGDAVKKATRIINTFESRSKSTGVLLSGVKGTGKTMMSRILGFECFKRGMPCLIINEPHVGDDFNQFIQAINQPTMIMFDEFEKVYPKEKQEHMLTLLDGVFPTKKLFVLTSNSMSRMDENMVSRPGRIFYHLDYKGLDEQFIRDYCEDNLINKKYIDALCSMTTLYWAFTFDMLQAIVEEMNRYDESPAEAVKMLNAKPDEMSRHISYDVVTYLDGKQLHEDDFDPSVINNNPMREGFHFNFYGDEAEGEDDNGFSEMFTTNDMVGMDAKTQTFTFEKVASNGRHIKIVMTRQKPKEVNSYLSLFGGGGGD